jgi:glycosyltransferase involved in cell wall biosynthesis
MEKKSRRVVVVTSDVPFVEGGHLTIARETVRALREYGCEADLVLTPQNRFDRQFSAYLANYLTDVQEDGLGRRIHQVISFRYPSFAVRHPHHVCWLNHRLREYYDLWEFLFPQLGLRGKLKEHMKRSLIRTIDTYLLKNNVHKLFAQSKTIQQRLMRWGHIPSEVLYPPPPYKTYRTDSYDNFIFAVSRLQRLKRLDLFIEAFRYVQNRELRGVIIGRGPEKENLQNLIKRHDLEERIMIQGEASENRVLDSYAKCLAVFFAPLREDYGFVTGEAFSCRKLVITTPDSGGPSELVENGRTGYIVGTDPKKIAQQFDRLAEDKDLAEKMGEQAFDFISQITWEKTIKKLLIV